MPVPTLHTSRLLLRALTPQDEQEIFELRSSDAVNRYLDRPKAQSIEDARQFIQRIIEGEGLYWVITLKNDPKLIGTIAMWNFDAAQHSAELGYELLPPYQGQGLMQEALGKAIEYGFTVMQLKTITAESHINNLGSIKLLEKNQFRRQPQQQEPDMVIYQLHKA